MLFTRSDINRAVSAMLLFTLLLIHSVKLLHSHSDNFFDSNKIEIVKPSSDCSICSYQINKDADDLVYPALGGHESQPVNFEIQFISFHEFSLHTAFENRGPPSLM
jgi:hypothetical protein